MICNEFIHRHEAWTTQKDVPTYHFGRSHMMTGSNQVGRNSPHEIKKLKITTSPKEYTFPIFYTKRIYLPHFLKGPSMYFDFTTAVVKTNKTIYERARPILKGVRNEEYNYCINQSKMK
eukprot:GHVP01022527.1.p1 GENE.GHVP01022527.1~~GHVP01022527.1.p1  ORF type:complete len:119 (+),score=12.83 GHVP01022527.1:449-805(+)